MYEAFYKLRENPFRLTPDPSFICYTVQHREALAGLVYSVCTRPGLTVLTGEAGTGKTTLLYALLDLLEKRRFVTALCNNPTMTREEFYDFLLLKLGIPCPSALKSRQLVALQEALLKSRKEGRPAVLIVDEAQRLPLELLEEIRLLLNLETPREKLLQIILAGQPELMEVLRKPALRQLKQRMSCLCRLEPLSLEELREYVQHRLAQAGLTAQTLFSEQALRLIHEYTGGIPRLVNTLCYASLQTGFALQSATMTKAIIDEAAAGLDLCGTAERLPDFPPVNGWGPVAVPAPEEKPVIATVAEGLKNGRNGDTPEAHESYASRQKSLGFLGGLMDWWR